MKLLIIRAVGYFFLVLGILLTLLPIPFGLFFIAVSLLILLPTSPRLARLIQGWRTRWAWLDRNMHMITRRLPSPYRRVFRDTEPQGIFRDF